MKKGRSQSGRKTKRKKEKNTYLHNVDMKHHLEPLISPAKFAGERLEIATRRSLMRDLCVLTSPSKTQHGVQIYRRVKQEHCSRLQCGGDNEWGGHFCNRTLHHPKLQTLFVGIVTAYSRLDPSDAQLEAALASPFKEMSHGIGRCNPA